MQLKPSYRDVPELVRDLTTIQGQAPEIRTLTAQFKNLTVQGLRRMPLAIELIRCTSTKDPSTPVDHGTAVSWTWTPQGARIDRLQGLTEGDTYLTLTLRITYG